MTPGTRLAGRFTIERHVGAGGMGNVYYARDAKDGERPVALKVLHEGDMSAVDVERFHREASVLAELEHPGIVGYVDHGIDDAGTPYLAMEWVEGDTLAVRLSTERIGRDDALAMISAVAAALGAAHERGIVHRDIKPSNIVLAGGEVRRPRLLDFGIARHQDGDHVLTQTGAIVGTPGYMAPEQARGLATLDPRADVYAMGCLLFRCLTGRTPFVGAQAVAVLARTIIEDPPRLRETYTDASHALDELVAHLIARDPAKRLTDGAAVVRAIANLARLEEATDAAPLSMRVGTEAITNSQQRFVTAVLGSTGDTEERRDIAALAEIASAHDARFEALADGSILFLFSTASAPNDLAVRACRAAMALRDRYATAAVTVVSGWALVEGSVPIGELLDKAAASMKSIERGAILLDEGTATLVSDRFVLTNADDDEQDSGPRLLQRTNVDRVANAERGLLGQPTPCVGRDRELAFLEGLYEECVEESVARVAIVVAPPGAGKSRVRRELTARIIAKPTKQDPLILLGLGDPLGASTPLGMLGEALRRAAGCFDLGSRDAEQSHLTTWLAHRLGKGHTAIPLLLDAFGMESTTDATLILDSSRDASLRAWMQWLGAELDVRPVVIMLEDLHWGDLPTVEFLDASLRAFAKKQLMVVALARPEVKSLFPNLWAEREPQELRLGPLTRAASTALVRAVVVEKTDDATITLLVDRAGGNAFFLEELIRALASSSSKGSSGGGGKKGDEVDALPDTVLAVIQARLDGLGPDLTRALRAASVFGETFWKEGLATLLGVEVASRRLAMWLTTLIDRELIEPKAETLVKGAHQLVFRHALVREGAYAMLTEEDRRLGHRLAGEWLESRDVREAAILAEHYDRAHDAERAIHWSCIDAERAVEAYDPSAWRRAERGIKLGATGMELGRLLVAQAQTLERRSDATAREAATKALALFRPATVEWYGAMRVVVSQVGTHPSSKNAFAEASIALAEMVPEEGDTACEVEYILAMTTALVHAGRAELPATIPVLVAALSNYMHRADSLPPRAGACLYGVMSMGAALGKNPERALRAAQRAMELKKAAGEIDLEGEITLSQRFAYLGQIADAQAIIDRVEAEGERLGIAIAIGIARYAQVVATTFREDYERGFELAVALRKRTGAFQEPTLLARLELLVAECAFRTGRIAIGEEAIAMGRKHAREASPLWCRFDLVQAEGLIAAGRATEALVVVDALTKSFYSTPFDQDDAQLAFVHARALLESGGHETEARAREVMTKGIAELYSVASAISDPKLREGFLSAIPAHKRLIALARKHDIVFPALS